LPQGNIPGITSRMQSPPPITQETVGPYCSVSKIMIGQIISRGRFPYRMGSETLIPLIDLMTDPTSFPSFYLITFNQLSVKIILSSNISLPFN
jgi:hypothetical protein